MSFYSKIPKKTPQDIWKEIQEIGGRIIQTIPFESSIEEMEGFIAVIGKEDELPVITFCVANPTKDKAIAVNIVFDSTDRYNSFIDNLNIDLFKNFSITKDFNWEEIWKAKKMFIKY